VKGRFATFHAMPRRRLFILALLSLIAFLVWLANTPSALISLLQLTGAAIEPTRGPTPPAPTLTVPRGALPTGHVSFEEWANGQKVGSGFLLEVPNNLVLGVTTAHSLFLVGPQPTLSFRLPHASSAFITFTDFYGQPGTAFTGYNFDADFVFLSVAEIPAEVLVLKPDTRGLPELGERVVLYSGLGDERGQPRALWGTVTAAAPNAVWAQMDEVFAPDGMSGSPLLSAHTGQVVGLAVSGGHSAPILLGFHPVGSLVEKAEAVERTP
jgi:hypothetical protein